MEWASRDSSFQVLRRMIVFQRILSQQTIQRGLHALKAVRIQNACPPLSLVKCSCNDARPPGSYATEKYSHKQLTSGGTHLTTHQMKTLFQPCRVSSHGVGINGSDGGGSRGSNRDRVNRGGTLTGGTSAADGGGSRGAPAGRGGKANLRPWTLGCTSSVASLLGLSRFAPPRDLLTGRRYSPSLDTILAILHLCSVNALGAQGTVHPRQFSYEEQCRR